MLFNSFQFLFFFPIVTILYFALPHIYRWLLLLLASCVFYMAFIPYYIFILFFTIIIDYIAGICIENAAGRRKKLFLIISLISNLGILGFFKYFNFFNANLGVIGQWLNTPLGFKNLTILLPIGLSFHTFQAMSYTIEVYRGKQKAERHFGIYSLYVMFYPQLVAGPIERPQNLLHQFLEKHEFTYTRVTDGLKLMLWGFFKKIVIADRLAEYVDEVYNKPGAYHGLPVIIATVFFAFQIYCDFSGYSDIAIGAAQVMGFSLMDNFNRPYFAKSISEFWRRWHISLSTWFKDYLYIPLGGSRVAVPRLYFNLFIVFLLSGLWHGANWTFIIWGALNGFYLIIELMTKGLRSKLPSFFHLKITGIFITFGLICFSWIFFRASNLHNAFLIIQNIVVFTPGYLQWNVLENSGHFWIGVFGIIFMETIHLMQRHTKMRHFLSEKPIVYRWTVYIAILWAIFIFGVFSEREFIYFVF